MWDIPREDRATTVKGRVRTPCGLLPLRYMCLHVCLYIKINGYSLQQLIWAGAALCSKPPVHVSTASCIYWINCVQLCVLWFTFEVLEIYIMNHVWTYWYLIKLHTGRTSTASRTLYLTTSDSRLHCPLCIPTDFFLSTYQARVRGYGSSSFI